MPLLKKTVLNVSFPPWMAVVLVSSVFALQTRSSKYTRMYIFERACGCFLYVPSICTVYLQKRWRWAHLLYCPFSKMQILPDSQKNYLICLPCSTLSGFCARMFRLCVWLRRHELALSGKDLAAFPLTILMSVQPFPVRIFR